MSTRTQLFEKLADRVFRPKDHQLHILALFALAAVAVFPAFVFGVILYKIFQTGWLEFTTAVLGTLFACGVFYLVWRGDQIQAELRHRDQPR